MEVRQKFVAMSPTLMKNAPKFVERCRREGKLGTKEILFINPHPKFKNTNEGFDDKQRLVWLLAQMAMQDDLPANEPTQLLL